jgi:hypothetical protein
MNTPAMPEGPDLPSSAAPAASFNNLLNSLTLPEDLRSLDILNLSGNNALTNLIVPSGLSSLTIVNIAYTQLRSLTLPSSLGRLTTLDLPTPSLTNLVMPAGIRWLDPPLPDLRSKGVHVTLFPHNEISTPKRERRLHL